MFEWSRGACRHYAVVVASVLCVLLVGVVAPIRAHASSLRDSSGPLVQGRNGPVMHKVVVYTIFWLPTGMSFEPANSGLSDDDYMGVVNNFFLDVGGSDYYDVLTQYGDKKGPIRNDVTLADSAVDTSPYPAGKGSQTNPLLDSDLQHEIVKVIKAKHWPNQKLVSAFFVFTADGIQSCDGSSIADSTGCTFSAQNDYCGYHNYFIYKKKPLIDANGPDILDSGKCDGNDPTTQDNAPNADPAADIQVNNAAHELAEMATDPLMNAWGATADNSSEVADLCDTAFLPRDDGGGDVTLGNGDEYYLQALYSNQDGGCVFSLGGTTVTPAPPLVERGAPRAASE